MNDAIGELEAVALQEQRRTEERHSQRATRQADKTQQVGAVGRTGGASASHLSTHGTQDCLETYHRALNTLVAARYT